MKIGIDIGGSHIAAGLVENETIINKIELDITQKDKKNINLFLEFTIVKFINMILRKNKLYIWNIETIGIASPGTIINGKIITNVVNLGIERINIYNVLRKYYKYVDIKVQNDAKCAAIAEKKYGNMKNYEDCLFICCGTGVGGAVYLNDKLLEPKTNSGFELGHMIINKNGLLCNCGKRGCFDVYGSMKNFKKKITKEIGLKSSAVSYEILPKIEKNKNEKIMKIIDDYTTNLSIGISNLINIFEPEIIVIGGSFAHYESILLEPLKEKIIKEKLLFNKGDKINIVTAKFLNDAGIIGAANI